jgi:hypothetical protein
MSLWLTIPLAVGIVAAFISRLTHSSAQMQGFVAPPISFAVAADQVVATDLHPGIVPVRTVVNVRGIAPWQTRRRGCTDLAGLIGAGGSSSRPNGAHAERGRGALVILERGLLPCHIERLNESSAVW